MDIYKQKRIWLDKFGLDDYPLYGVKHSHEKGQYATEASLLIDDYHVSVDSFVNAGGHAIKHHSPIETNWVTSMRLIIDHSRLFSNLYGGGSHVV
jgi:hypothetical protein